MAAPTQRSRPSATPRRVFLGWRSPLLPAAAEWLLERVGVSGRTPGPPDLQRLLAVVPGRRAGRRLLQNLAALPATRASGLAPPTVATPGALAELLFEPDRPLAGVLESRLARAEALRRAPVELRARVAPNPPAADDLPGWLDVAAELERVEEELAAEGLDLASARRRLEAVTRAAGVEHSEGERWDALARLADDAGRRLATAGREGRQAFRLRAAAGGAAAARHGLEAIVLVGVVDLPGLFRALLERSGVEIVALIAAPSEEADAFDDWGCPRSESWARRELALTPGVLVVADRPSDQAGVAVERVLAWRPAGPSGADGSGAAAEVSVVAGDPALTSTVVDLLARVGMPAHAPQTRSLAASLPAAILAQVARWVAGRRVADLGALLRLPPVEGWVAARLTAAVDAQEPSAGAVEEAPPRTALAHALAERRWLAAFDRFAMECVSERLDGPLGGDAEGRALVRAIDSAIEALLLPDPAAPELGGAIAPSGPAPSVRAELSEWAPVLARLLERLFGGEEAAGSGDWEEISAETDAALVALGDLLREAVAVRRSPPLALADAIAVLLRLLAEARPAGDGAAGDAVEVLGWLEVGLDDAPDLVVVGLNEGVIPASIPADPFLPDGARRGLGLLDDRRRLARDLYLLTLATRSRRTVALVAGRRTAEGEPLAPSRLLLRRAPAELASEVTRFFEEEPRSGVTAALGSWGRVTGFDLPRPAPAPPIDGLPVTAFRDYLACPYRFYLRHVLGLEPVREPARELDAALFGRLAHDVLRRFAAGGERDEADEERIFAVLAAELEAVVRVRVGSAPLVAVRVQIAQLRRRLEVFARWQAAQAHAGWRIAAVERRLVGRLEVDGEPFEVRGQLDRIDTHRDGRWRILDFKTSDSPKKPEPAHRRGPRGDKRWIDLQLPLYRRLALDASRAELAHQDPGLGGPGLAEVLAAGDEPELGFYSLSKKLAAEPYAAAGWDAPELAAAEEVAAAAVRAIRAQRFWPPADPPIWDDGFALVAGDTLALRAGLSAVAPPVGDAG
ncbi:MAG TPA: PD-(D/E)XK nuclease family protein [Thermoanaerobaculia bacterium]|nr:PD-(D/E)XK nuclease family protein [Thermoanaerobaculia bacterium]